MSVDIASLASAVGAGASILAAAGAAAELVGREQRMKVGQLTIKLSGLRKEGGEVDDAEARARQVLAALDDVSATEYALDPETRRRIDGEIHRAIKLLERRST